MAFTSFSSWLSSYSSLRAQVSRVTSSHMPSMPQPPKAECVASCFVLPKPQGRASYRTLVFILLANNVCVPREQALL